MNEPTPTPTVSIVATCFNQARWLEEALDSVAAQSFDDWELIVTDDGSTDGSQALIAQWLESTGLEAQQIFLDENVGLCEVLNRALARCRGRYFVQLGCDDRFRPGFLARGVELLEAASPDVVAVYGDGSTIDERGGLINPSYMDQNGARPLPSGAIFERLLERNLVLGCSVMYRRAVIEELGGWDPDLPFEDWDLHLRAAARHSFHYVDEVLSDYRIHDESMTRANFPEMVHGRLAIQEKWLGRNAAWDETIIPYLRQRSWRLFKVRPDLGRDHVAFAYGLGGEGALGRARHLVATRGWVERSFDALRLVTRAPRRLVTRGLSRR